MMHEFSRISLLLTLSGASALSIAKNSVDLAMTGTIAPPACSLSLDRPSVNVGRIAYGDRLKDGGTALDSQDVTLSVSCAAEARNEWSVSDNRAGSQIDTKKLPKEAYPQLATIYNDVFFGLGTAGRDRRPIGAMRIMFMPGITVDNSPLSEAKPLILRSTGAYGGWTRNQSMYGVNPENSYSPGTRIDTTNTIRPYTTAVYPLRVFPVIAPRRDLPATEEIQLDGSVTFTLRYL